MIAKPPRSTSRQGLVTIKIFVFSGYMWVGSFVNTRVEAQRQAWVLFLRLPFPPHPLTLPTTFFFSWRQSFSLAWGPQIQLGWLSSKPQGPTCLHLLSAGIISTYQQITFLFWDRILQYSPGYPDTYWVDQSGLELTNIHWFLYVSCWKQRLVLHAWVLTWPLGIELRSFL